MTPEQRQRQNAAVRQKRRENADPTDPIRKIPDEMLHEAIERAIEKSDGKLYTTDVFWELFGKLKRGTLTPSTKQSVKYRTREYMKDYPVLVHTRYTVIWDVSK